MAILEMTLEMTYFGQRCLNRFNYQSSGAPSTSETVRGLGVAFGSVFDVAAPVGSAFDAILDIQNNDLVYDQVLIKDVYDPTSFYETPFPAGTSGKGSTDALAPYDALALRTTRTRLDIKRGMKRFAGVALGSTLEGGIVAPTAIANLTALGVLLADVLEFDDNGTTVSYTPIIVSKEKYVTPSGKNAYRYYADEADQVDHVMSGFAWEAYDTTRTQNSRQYGRGQ